MPAHSATQAGIGTRLKPASVAFAYPGNRTAIRLRDPVTDQLQPTPEWVAGGHSAPAAYVRGTRPTIQVGFTGPAGKETTPLRVKIGARSERGPAIAPRQVELRFNADGRSAPVEFELASPLPDAIGRVLVRWQWYLAESDGEASLGSTDHEILLTWAPLTDPADWAGHLLPLDPPGQASHRWTYLPILKWTTEWAAGHDDPKAICDAIIAQVWKSGLQYGVGAWTVRDMLNAGGGYCGGWYRMFQAMAGSQGVAVERRSYMVDWPAGDAANGVEWCAIVVSHAGLNRTEPVEGAAAYHDADRAPLATCPVEEITQRRYRFWGLPGRVGDGHCINFLRHDGRDYLYDASFFDHAIELSGFTLPSGDGTGPVDVREQGDFLTAYLSRAVGFMLGSLENRGERYTTVHPVPGTPGAKTRNGLTVKTPVVLPSGSTIRFYWSS